jgi:hypothetical protein
MTASGFLASQYLYKSLPASTFIWNLEVAFWIGSDCYLAGGSVWQRPYQDCIFFVANFSRGEFDGVPLSSGFFDPVWGQ